MTDLPALIAALRSATGPNRALGDRVLLAAGWRWKQSGWSGPAAQWLDPDGVPLIGYPPNPAASVDAVKQLEDGVRLRITGIDGGRWLAERWDDDGSPFFVEGRGATEPLARSIAWALAQQAEGGE